MSKSLKSAKSSKLQSTSAEEVLTSTVAELRGTDPDTLPFKHWSDDEINAIHWDEFEGKGSSKSKHEIVAANLYLDPQAVYLPESCHVNEWKRPEEIFPNAKWIVYKDSDGMTDLYSANKHIQQNYFVKISINVMLSLEYISYHCPWPSEGVTEFYTPTTENYPWKGWHHVYSLCKAGKGQRHNPQLNRYGKYVIRLYWFGGWKQVYVDDLLPVDVSGNILLPSTYIPIDEKIKQREIELWPFLLVKALLKFSALTWNKENEFVDFFISHSFTGWPVCGLFNWGLTLEDAWKVSTNCSTKYQWPEDKQLPEETIQEDEQKEKEINEKEKKKKQTKKKETVKKDICAEKPENYLFLLLKDLSTFPEDFISGLTPTSATGIFVTEFRDVPLEKPPTLPELPKWKTFRWLPWAIQKGLWPNEKQKKKRYVKIITPIRPLQLNEEQNVSLLKKEITLMEEQTAAKENLHKEKTSTGKKNKEKTKEKSSKKDKSSKSSKFSKSSKKSKKTKSKSSGKSRKNKKEVVPPKIDYIFWVDFEKIFPLIDFYGIIMHSPGQLETWIQISDLEPQKSKKENKSKNTTEPPSNITYIKYPCELKVSRNQPLYIFTDSIDEKLLHISFEHSGNVDILKKIEGVVEKDLEKFGSSTVCNIRNCPAYNKQSNSNLHRHRKVLLDRPISKFVINAYNWQSNAVGKVVLFGSTYGKRGYMMEIKPGRFVYQLFINSSPSYYFHIMTKSYVVAGSEEVIIEHMTKNSDRLTNMCYQVSSCFGKLVQAFGTPDYIQSMRNFIKSLKPEEEIPKTSSLMITDTFLGILMNTIYDSFTDADLPDVFFALQVLFLDTRFKFQFINVPKSKSSKYLDRCLCEKDSEEELEIEKHVEKSAVRITSIFRGFFIRKLLGYHKQTNERYLEIFNTLHKVYMTLFGVDKRVEVCVPMLRKLIFSETMATICQYYGIYHDMQSQIELKKFTGLTNAEAGDWVAITKHVFYCKSSHPVPVKIILFSNLTKYVVRVFNNDTNQEMRRFTNNVLVEDYKSNKNGYTVVSYGWAEETKSVPWKLCFITPQWGTKHVISVNESFVMQQIITDYYIPNPMNLICKCVIKLQDNNSLIFRLSTSSEGVKVLLKCCNFLGEVFGEITGTTNVVLPLVQLVCDPKTESQTPENLSHQKVYTVPSKISFKKFPNKQSIIRIKSEMSTISKTTMSKTSSLRISSMSSKSLAESIYKETEFIVEAYVLDDSWPLTKEEWDVVETAKKKKLVRPNDPECCSLKIEETSLSSKLKSKSSEVDDTFKKLASAMRHKSSLKSATTSFRKEKPNWKLYVAHESSSFVIVEIDRRREDEIRKMKKSWYDSDPSRYATSCELRNKYLESNMTERPSEEDNVINIRADTKGLISEDEIQMIPKFMNIEIQKLCADTMDVSETEKTLTKKESKILTPLDLSQYYLPGQNQKTLEEWDKVLIDKIEDKLEAERKEKLEQYLELKEALEDERKKIINQQERRITILQDWFVGIRTDTQIMIADTYKLREQVINSLIEREKAKQKEDNEEKKKTKGDKKKSKKSK